VSFPRQGEIFPVTLPGRPTDKTRRPAVVVSPDYRNEYANDVLVVPLSTQLRPMPTHVPVPAGAGGLKKASVAKAEQITALPKSFLSGGPLGPRISAGTLREIHRAVLRALGADF
jgi:mRNA-degrading endonuclease toxin of MazEF toxin-antitoxin module